jgi:hypothetical protein
MNDTTPTARYAIGRAGGLDHTNIDELNRSLRRALHDRDGYTSRSSSPPRAR